MRIYRLAQSSPDLIPSWQVASDVESGHHTHEDLIDGDVLQRVHKFDFYRLVDYPIWELNLGEFDLEEDRVEEYAKGMASATFPPIVVDTSWGAPSIIDGIHRANAAKALGMKTIKAYVPAS